MLTENEQKNTSTSTTPTGDSVKNELHSENTETPPSTNNNPEKKENFWFELLKIVLLAIIIVVPIRTFIAQPFIVNGASMDNKFANGQYLIIDQLSYRFDEPQRGEVIVFRFPLEPSKFFIKRIIGLPYDTVILQGKTTIIINEENPEGLLLKETYLSPENTTSDSFSITLNDGEYFVMGDNRKNSSDSRSWGVLNREHIVGQAFVRLFPITSFSILPGQ
jgi:signal peptidase I